jgi:hypothetical protein
VINKGNTCPKSPSPPKDLPKETVECALGWTYSTNGTGRYYILSSDGTIWYWKVPTGSDNIDPAVLISTLVGFISGGILGGIFIKRLVVS